MHAIARAAAAAALLLTLSACATTGTRTPGDPLERMNRATQRFNDALDRAVLKPLAERYRRHVPRPVRTGIGNVLSHLAFPTTIANDLLQGKLADTGADLGRFAINSTLGIGGLLDPATRIGIRRNDEDFGQTLGRWGVRSGPYLVLPVLGPSTLRDTVALGADAQTDLRVQLDLKPAERAALGVTAAIDARAGLLSADAAIDSAFDRYAFIRDAWLQRREYKVRDGDVPSEEPPLEDPEDWPAEDESDQPSPAVAGPSSDSTSAMPASADSSGGIPE